MMLTRNRYVAALMLLILMVANFAAEGYSVYQAHGVGLLGLGAMEVQACAMGPATAKYDSDGTHSEGSCCSKKKAAPKASACGCAHCGDHCPMGDACTCMQSTSRQASKSEGLFFKVPGCHPEQTLDGNYLPLSMRVVFVTAAAIVPAFVIRVDAEPGVIPVMKAGLLPAPPVPPPQCVAA